MPAPIKKVLGGSSRKELINSINSSLMVFDNELVHIEFGSKAKLDNHDANAIAFAAKQLLADSPEEISVLLLMPPAEFVASAHSLPGISKENLISLIKIVFYQIIFNKEKRNIFICRLNGIINSILGKKSWYRPSLD